MEPSSRQPEANDVVNRIVQHLRQYPCNIRHIRKVMRSFRATAEEIEQAINQVSVPLTLDIDPTTTGDQVLLHFLRYPGDMIDMRRVMQQLHASERDVQQAFEKLAIYIVEGGEGVMHAGTDKQ